MFLKTALLVLRKDFAIEIKSYEILATTLFFAVGCVLVFAFALVKAGQAPPDAAAAILWIALLFAAPLLARLTLLLPLLVCGTVGFAAVGTLFAAMLMRARTRDVMLPILLYPMTIPVIIAGVRGTSALLASPPDEPTAIMWLAILGAFDVVFVTLSLWTFEPLMTE